MSHLTDEQRSALMDGALEGGERAVAERHLETCAECRAALAGLVALDQALASTLGHDPGDAYFESFAGRVGGRLRAASLAGAQAREPGSRSLADWFRSPRKLALVGAVATVVAGAGIVMLSTREMSVPALREREIESRAAQEAPPAPMPPGIQPRSQSVARGALPPAAESQAPPLAARSVTPPPPSAMDLEDGAAGPRDDSRAKASFGSGTELPTHGRGRHAPTNRAHEVRRNEAGEDVPVGRTEGFAAGAPPLAPMSPPAAPGEPIYVRKQRYAEPLVAGKQADALQVGARPLPAAAEASTSPADQDVPVAAVKAAREEESKPVADPGAAPAVASRKKGMALGLTSGLMGEGGRAGRGSMLQVRGTPEAFDGLPVRLRALAKNAQGLTTAAETTGLAPAWDSAAAAWESVIESVQGGPLESEARFQAARARFMAWQRTASGKRSTSAGLALGAFLEHAPQGAGRDSAQAWLARLKP